MTARAEPMRRASAAGVPMQHPAPDSHHPRVRSRTHARNVHRLELSAAAISDSGSDLSDEIRRIYRLGSSGSDTRLSRTDTRSSRRSGLVDELLPGEEGEEGVSSRTRIKMEDASRGVSGGVSSGRGDLDEEYRDSSFGRRYDEIAANVHAPAHATAPNDLEGNAANLRRHASNDTFHQANLAFQDFDGVHFHPETAAESTIRDEDGHAVRRVSARISSGATASMLRMPAQRMSYGAPPPADGMVYYPAPVPKMLNLPKRLSQLPAAHVQSQRRSQVLGHLTPEARQSAPWLPPLKIDDEVEAAAHRKSGSSSALPDPAALLRADRTSANLNDLARLPPQLRASVFFNQHSVPHPDVAIQADSAVATLDSILAASATAPVSSFVDHPFVGDVRDSVYALEKSVRRSSVDSGLQLSPDHNRAKRRSSIGNLLRRRNTDDVTTTLKKSGSRGSLFGGWGLSDEGNKLRKRKSTLSLGDELEKHTQAAHNPSENVPANYPTERRTSTEGLATLDHGVTEPEETQQESPEPEEQPDLVDEAAEPTYAQPTTLLAELQVRKAQLKSRTRTAATMFPNGMHSTLLQLDAVEAIAQKHRQHARVPLAWEDPALALRDAEREDDDEDLPLGMLFANREGTVGGTRSLGLMEKRALEDSEPLSSRRNRLRGVSPSRALGPSGKLGAGLGVGASTSNLLPDEAGDDADDETLAQRMRRVKTKDALDGAIADVAPTASEEQAPSTFADDLLSQFGGLKVTGDKPKQASSPAAPAQGTEEEEETLAQRRARLQREREAPGSSSTNARPASNAYQPPAGTLLHASAQQQARHKSQLQGQNRRSSSQTLLQDRQRLNPRPPVANRGFFAGGGAYNHHGAAGVQIASPTSSPLIGAGGAGQFPAAGGRYAQVGAVSYQLQPSVVAGPFNPLAFPPAGGMPSFPSPYGFQQQQQPMMMGPQAGYPYGYGVRASGGYPTSTGLGMGIGMGMAPAAPVAGLGFPADAPLPHVQRAAIDRWRMDIGH